MSIINVLLVTEQIVIIVVACCVTQIKNFWYVVMKNVKKMFNDVLDESAEWRYYGADDSQIRDPTRCGMPINPLLKESSYGCKVVCNNRSSWEMRKIRRYTEWQSMPYKEKSQYDEFEKIKSMANQAGIPKIIIDEALRQHKKISEMKTFRGCNRDGIIAASIYIYLVEFISILEQQKK